MVHKIKKKRMAVGQLLYALCVHIGVALQKQTASFKVPVRSRQKQRSFLTEYKNMKLAQTKFPMNPIKKKYDAVGSSYFVFFAFTLALLSTRRRQSSTCLRAALNSSGVFCLKKSIRLNVSCRQTKSVECVE